MGLACSLDDDGMLGLDSQGVQHQVYMSKSLADMPKKNAYVL
jgi:hypothetical protein